ncbi:MAG: hypothetical protein ABEJ55_07175 [Halanaeroarchaeum sp.]
MATNERTQSGDAESQLMQAAGVALVLGSLLVGAYSILSGDYLTAGTLVLFVITGGLLFDIGRA